MKKYSAHGSTSGTPQPQPSSGTGTEGGGVESASQKDVQQPPKKKQKAGINKGKLSFAPDEEEEDSGAGTDVSSNNLIPTNPISPAPNSRSISTTPEPPTIVAAPLKPKHNPLLPHPPPKALTKSTLRREAQERELLRREFLALQERIKNEEIVIPFVFYDGTNIIPRERGVKVKKGEAVWLFLERARRMSGRREWLRVSVDDLLLVRGEVIIPHHYEFYYFLVNLTEGPNGLLFNYPSPLESNPPDSSNTPAPTHPVRPTVIVGTEDPTMTKVVDRRWYERNKHIFPASVWTNFDPTKDYKGMVRRDRDNNAFFFG